jgi:hypothetical protein
LIGLLSTSGNLIIVREHRSFRRIIASDSSSDTVQRGFSTDPDQLSSSNGQSAESAMLVASLREVIRQQAEEIDALQKRLKVAASSDNKVRLYA